MLLPKPLYIKLTDLLHSVLSWGVKHVIMSQHVDRHAPLVLLIMASFLTMHAQGFFQGRAGGSICPPLALACPPLDMLILNYQNCICKSIIEALMTQ